MHINMDRHEGIVILEVCNRRDTDRFRKVLKIGNVFIRSGVYVTYFL